MSAELTVDSTTMLAIVYSALVAALGATSLGVIRAWREVAESREAAKLDRDALLKKHGELAVEMAAMKAQIATLEEQWKNRPLTEREQLYADVAAAYQKIGKRPDDGAAPSTSKP